MSNLVQLPCSTVYSPSLQVQLEELTRHICYELGTRALPFMHREMHQFCFEDGVELAMMYRALESTLKAPRPTWAYFRAIIIRCINEGVTTERQFSQRTLNHSRYKEID